MMNSSPMDFSQPDPYSLLPPSCSFGGLSGYKLVALPVPTKLVQARRHRRRRIDKKWRKRYGFVRVPDPAVDQDVLTILDAERTVLCYPPALAELLRQLVQKQAERPRTELPGLGRPDIYVLDADGEPIPEADLAKWGRFMEDLEQRSVAYNEWDTPDGRVAVSTVFLGLDHNFRLVGAPVLYETVIFGGAHDGYQKRYSDPLTAMLGHGAALAVARHPEWQSGQDTPE